VKISQEYVILNFKARNPKSEIAVFQTNPNDQKKQMTKTKNKNQRPSGLAFVLNFEF
jgi:hypothetical protein